MRPLTLVLLLLCALGAHAAKQGPHGPIQLDCSRCHATTGWSLRTDAVFDHDVDTAFPLEGVHSLVSCGTCHVDNRFTDTGGACVDCHLDPHQGSLGASCLDCHSPERWIDRARMQSRHERSLFPLTGAHRRVDCALCHTGSGATQFASTPMECAACHQGDYLATRQPNHQEGGLVGPCNSCHTTSRWSGTGDFQHDAFPLTGAHATQTCAACHQGSQFNAAPETCSGCHQSAWSASTNPAHGAAGFSQNCASCHQDSGWRPSSYSHALETGYALNGSHAIVGCASCHQQNVYAGTASACFSCHQQDFQAATSPAHQEQGYPTDCTLCHTETAWNGAAFDHQTTDFPLLGAHSTALCSDCHLGGETAFTPTDCWSCHQSAYAGTTDPAHGAGLFPQDCRTCHNETAWDPATLDHQSTLFPLQGAHVTVSCADCHTAGQFAGNATDCWSCHQGDYAATTDPAHESGLFPQDCLACHDENAWDPGTLDHNLTDFPLTGAHITTSCVDCHVNGQYTNLPGACWDCHAPEFRDSDDPDHETNEFSQTCTDCHDTQAWRPSTFNHALTEFPLTGAHSTTSCVNCHLNGQYTNLPGACWNCHEPDFRETVNPDHEQNLLPQSCTDCHNTSAWTPSTFSHSLTEFPLTGAHLATSCISCHANGQYVDLPGACWNCHEPDYRETVNPDHEQNQLSQSCTDCHNTTAWVPSTFSHALTEFPLTGAHLATSCISCHVGGQYVDIPGDCWSCHASDFQGSDNPDHEQNQFSQTCTSCHNTTAWVPSTFNHTLTDFPLTGAHVAISCASCHVNGQYTDLPGACWNCHEPDYLQADDPDHEQNQFSQTCTSCHNTTAWVPSTFNHALTDFPLTGAHTTVSCATCHVNGQYAGTPADCWSCHQEEYQGVTNPNHVTGNYPHDCIVCHTTTQWDGATFNHSSTDFPLTGAHVTVSCAQCHVNGQYENTPTDCFFCHESDYQSASNPEHESHGYPTDCASCHSTAAGWNSSFNHATYFPIYTGNHRNEWTTCATCHLGNDLTDFSCTHCHDHSQSEMNGEHDEVGGYVWESHACLNCHPNGSELRGGVHPRIGQDLRFKEPLR